MKWIHTCQSESNIKSIAMQIWITTTHKGEFTKSWGVCTELNYCVLCLIMAQNELLWVTKWGLYILSPRFSTSSFENCIKNHSKSSPANWIRFTTGVPWESELENNKWYTWIENVCFRAPSTEKKTHFVLLIFRVMYLSTCKFICLLWIHGCNRSLKPNSIAKC